jgi:soluble lytic murein transglycosylase-like protein
MSSIWRRLVAAAAVASVAAVASGTAAGARPTAVPVRYTVRAGDSFYGIAGRFFVPPAQLAHANRMSMTNVLRSGQTLTIPGVVLPTDLPAHLPAALRANVDRLILYPRFTAAAKEFGLPADLLMATAYIESGWKQSAVSPTGAVGVGQLKPDTSAWISTVLLHDPQLDPTDVRDNIRMSARFLRYVLDTSAGDTARALAS